MTVTKKPSAADQKNRTRIARFLLTSVNDNSALLPTDKWIVTTATDVLRKNRDIRKNGTRLLIGFAATAVSIGLGITGAFMAFPAFPAMLLAGGIGIMAGYIFGQGSVSAWQDLRIRTLPSLRSEIAARYFKMKSDEVVNAWKNNMRNKKSDKKPLETKKQDIKITDTPSLETAVPETPVNKEKDGNVAGKVGGWLLRQAMKKASTKEKPDDTVPNEKPVKPVKPEKKPKKNQP